ncbi:MAG: hypothetical protein Q9186_005017 [Xanthomendoza sp. 1 TL-2023]
MHLDGLCLDHRGQYIASGGQFMVFKDNSLGLDDVVIKRVHKELLSEKPSSKEMGDRRKGHLRTIELEILALSHAPIRDHPNIVKVRAWGFDYPTRDRRMALPVLFVEKASGSLLDLLQKPGSHELESISMETRYQLSMDILEGLVCLHNENIVHGDVKPANILVFRQQIPGVLFVAKISDFATATAFYHTVGFQERYTKCVAYAAESSIPAAQGIAGRLLLANGVTEFHDSSTTINWLQNAVSSGSLPAGEDLASRCPEKYQEARRRFRAAGGYNSKLDLIKSSITILPNPIPALDTKKAIEPCEQGTTVDAPVDQEGNTLLHYAATLGKCDVISYLVNDRGACVDVRNHSSHTPLYKACLSGHTAAVRSLMELGADSTLASQPYSITCLHWLFNFDPDEMESVSSLLAINGTANVNATIVPMSMGHQQRPIVSEHFPFHWPLGTPLHWAVAARLRRAIDILLQLYANINALDLIYGDDGQSALAMAIYRNDADMVECLYAKGASTSWIGSKGRNIIHIMVLASDRLNREFRLPRCIWSWVNHGPYRNRLQQLERCLQAVQTKGVQINLRRDRFQTPLVDAVEAGNTYATLILIRAGADCNIKCPTGELPV